MSSAFALREFAGLLDDSVQELFWDGRPGGPGKGGNVFLNWFPDKPDQAVMLTWFGGETGVSSVLRQSTVEARFRGANKDKFLDGFDLAAKAHDALHHWLRSDYPGYSGDIVMVVAAGPPQSIGYDELDRPESTVIFTVLTQNLTARN